MSIIYTMFTCTGHCELISEQAFARLMPGVPTFDDVFRHCGRSPSMLFCVKYLAEKLDGAFKEYLQRHRRAQPLHLLRGSNAVSVYITPGGVIVVSLNASYKSYTC